MSSAFNFIDSKGRDWYLHTQDVQLRSGRTQTIYYFSQTVNGDHALGAIPEGFEVFETTRTGMPMLRKI